MIRAHLRSPGLFFIFAAVRQLSSSDLLQFRCSRDQAQGPSSEFLWLSAVDSGMAQKAFDQVASCAPSRRCRQKNNQLSELQWHPKLGKGCDISYLAYYWHRAQSRIQCLWRRWRFVVRLKGVNPAEGRRCRHIIERLKSLICLLTLYYLPLFSVHTYNCLKFWPRICRVYWTCGNNLTDSSLYSSPGAHLCRPPPRSCLPTKTQFLRKSLKWSWSDKFFFFCLVRHGVNPALQSNWRRLQGCTGS